MPSTAPLPFDRIINAALGVVIVALVCAVAIWASRASYLPHKVAEFSSLTPAQIERRKSIYDLTRWSSGVALVIALLVLLNRCAE